MDQEIQRLKDVMDEIASFNFDGSVEVTHDPETGVVGVVVVNEDGEEESGLTAAPFGTVPGTSLRLYRYSMNDKVYDSPEQNTYGTLSPFLIMGMLAL